MTLEFDPQTHTYRAGGRVVPGVTRVIEPLSSFSEIPPDVLRRAAERGQAVHAACHYLDEGDLDTSTLAPEVVPYVEAWARFKADTRLVVLAMETVVHSERHGYAGRLDRIIDLGDGQGPAVLEIKSTALHPEVTAPLQTAAYLEAIPHALVDHDRVRRRYCVQIRPDGTYRLHEYPPSTQRLHFSLFLSALQIHNWRMNHD